MSAFMAAGLGLHPGDVVAVSDAQIKFPLNPKRKAHERRLCLVLSNNLICIKSDIITVAPMTSDLTVKSMSQLVLAVTPENGLQVESRLLLDQIQPIRKSDLTKPLGRLSATEWDLVMTKLIWNFDRA